MASEMLLNRQDFIDRVNCWAERHQAPGVNDRMLEDWNEECVFPAAIPISGSNSGNAIWFYNWRHYYRALLICRLKKQGRSRFSELRSILWLRGIEIPGGPPRDDLADEYERSVKNMLRPINSTYVPTFDENENANRAERLRKQLGEQAAVFKGTFLEAQDDQILAGYKEGRFSEPQGILRNWESSALGGLFQEWGLDRPNIPEGYWPPGLIAHPHENGNAGIALIRNASDDELNRAREMYWAILNLPSHLGLMAVGPISEFKLTGELAVSIGALKKSIIQLPAWRLALLVNFLAFEKQAADQAQLVNLEE